MFSKDKLFFLYLNNSKKMQPKLFNKLYFRYENLDTFLECIEEIKLPSEETRNEIISSAWEKKARPIAEYMDKNNICCIFYGDEDYPENLMNLDNPPAMLYYRGDISLLKGKCLSVVGSRIATSYGINATKHLVSQIAGHGVTIVSGMAEGIDGFAHSTALKQGGKTIAVLGGGVDFIYPLVNTEIYNEIVKNGLVISEYPLSKRPYPGNFPERNRIIASVSECLLVVEAGKKSGTLTTVDYALDLGKTIFAVPGDIFSTSYEGTNKLIKDGCLIALCPNDILEEYGIFPKEQKNEKSEFSGLDKEIIELLSREDLELCELINILKVDFDTISKNLVMLELKGAIEAGPGNMYSLKR